MSYAAAIRDSWITHTDRAGGSRNDVSTRTATESKTRSRPATYYPAKKRRRMLLTAVTTALSLFVAGWLGVTMGAGTLDAEARFNTEVVAAQNGEMSLYGPRQVPGHPGNTQFTRDGWIRQFIALDGVN